jgi:hypothetical protein
MDLSNARQCNVNMVCHTIGQIGIRVLMSVYVSMEAQTIYTPGSFY